MNPRYPLLYVAGPYRAPTREGVDLNIQAAKHVAAIACRKGYAPVVPHMNCANLDHIAPNLGDEFWLSITMEMMRKCDAVVLVPGWAWSAGTLAEIDEAKRIGIPVFDSVDTMPGADEVSAYSLAAKASKELPVDFLIGNELVQFFDEWEQVIPVDARERLRKLISIVRQGA